MIHKVSEETKRAILRKSPWALPDDPAGVGMLPEDIKKNFFRYITDKKHSALAELARVIDELNAEIDRWEAEIVPDIPNHSALIEEAEDMIEALAEYKEVAGTLTDLLEMALDTAYDANRLASTDADGLLAAKVTKMTGAAELPRLYAADGKGNETAIAVSADPVSHASVRYDTFGCLQTGEPTEDNDCITKKYVDTLMRRST